MNRLQPALKYSGASTRSSKAAINSSLYSDDDYDHDDDIIQAVYPRGINPMPSAARHNHRSILDSSESEDDQGHAQLYKPNKHRPCPKKDISSLLRMMLINLNQRVDVCAGAAGGGRTQFTINHNRRSVPDYSDSTDDEGLPNNHNRQDYIIFHFSHPHALNKYNISSVTNCKVCGLQLVGSAYGCQSCQFYLHTSCFDLPDKIQHHAHTAHPSLPFLLQALCIVKRTDTSRDTLRLYYTFPVGDGTIIARCNVCNKKVPKDGWVYYSKDTGHIAHIKCVKDAKVGPSWIKERLNMLKTK